MFYCFTDKSSESRGYLPMAAIMLPMDGANEFQSSETADMENSMPTASELVSQNNFKHHLRGTNYL